MEEKILIENPRRYTFFPIEYMSLFKLYKDSIANFWHADEILMNDKRDWDERLNDDERYFIKHVLAFFAASDGIVNENLAINFHNEVQSAEARAFYCIQLAVEAIHSETYSLLIDYYIDNEKEKEELFYAIENFEAIAKKAEWAIKWIGDGDKQDPATFAQRLIAFAVVEGIFFSGSFCAIFWLNQKGLLVDSLGKSNEWISRDEALHCRFACELYSLLDNKLDQETIHQLFEEAIDLEKQFILEALPVKLIGMNSDMMSQYIEYVADFWLTELGYDKIYNSKNPFDFMTNLSLSSKNNFFERTRPSEYRKADGADNPKVTDGNIDLDLDI